MAENIFNKVKMTKPNKSMFDLSHDVKLSCNMGNLVPVMCLDCVPGDQINVSAESLIRYMPMVAPVLHKMDVTMHYFFVPYRLLWDNWENWSTNTKVGSPTPALPSHPTIDILADGTNYTELMDYLGLPKPDPLGGSTVAEVVSALPLAAYQMIYNEYYRDQNLIPPVEYKLADGPNSATDLMLLRKRAWMHDYFTSCLPFAQKGDAVNIPVGLNDAEIKANRASFAGIPLPGTDVQIADPLGWQGQPSGTGVGVVAELDTPSANIPNTTNLYADNQNASVATTINDLRLAEALQKWLERAARGGSRYIEWIRTMFGVKSSDKRLQRPEYITGSKSPVTISEVLNTTGTVDAPQGEMAGHGIAVVSGNRAGYFCEEHGCIMGIMSVQPNTAYQQGINKMWLKYNDPSEIYNPVFAHLGEQEVMTREVYAFDADSNTLFGYIPRFAEHRFEPSRVAGQLRSTLDFWHLGRIFANAPALNQAFIECNPTHRVFAVTDENEHKLVCHVYNRVKAIRPMPKYGTPMM